MSDDDKSSATPPSLSLGWAELTTPAAWPTLAAALLQYVQPRRWFRSKARRPGGARVLDVVPLDGPGDIRLALVEIWYQPAAGEAGADGNGDRNGTGGGEPIPGDAYVVALACVTEERGAPGARAAATSPAVIAICADGVVVDGLASGDAADALLAVIRDGRVARGQRGELHGETSPTLEMLSDGPALAAKVPRVEQTNSTLTFGDQVLLKIYRAVTPGPSPELEVGRFLTESCDPPCSPRVLGALSYRADGTEARVVGIAHELIANEGDAWSVAQRELDEYFARAANLSGADQEGSAAPSPVAPVGRFSELAETLGRRTGELHLALAGMRAASGHDPWTGAGAAFRPRPLTTEDRALQAARVSAMLAENLAALSASAARLSPPAQELARALLERETARTAVEVMLARFRDGPLEVMKTRTHGDLHLGQVLALAHDGLVDDFMIIDFEGEPARPLAERRAMSSPIRDVMGMVRSFDYAPEAALRQRAGNGGGAAGDAHPGEALTAAAARWTRQVTGRYLAAYRGMVDDAPFMPRAPEQLSLLLAFYQLEKVVYELGYEINNRPDWVEIPLRGLARVLGASSHEHDSEGSSGHDR